MIRKPHNSMNTEYRVIMSRSLQYTTSNRKNPSKHGTQQRLSAPSDGFIAISAPPSSNWSLVHNNGPGTDFYGRCPTGHERRWVDMQQLVKHMLTFSDESILAATLFTEVNKSAGKVSRGETLFCLRVVWSGGNTTTHLVNKRPSSCVAQLYLAC